MNEDEDCNIRVICRFRPVNKRELAEGGGLAPQLSFPDEKSVEVAAWNGRQPNTFNFDRVFSDPKTRQQDVYDLAAFQSINDVIKGYNSTIFAYGQTGAGKSWTMFGDIAVSENKGIIPRACGHIFSHINQDTEGTEYTIKCSFLEIYREIVRDLLNPAGSGAKGLRVREAPNKGVWVEGLHEAYVTCEEDVLDLIRQGEGHRATSSTSMNASSSRSHSLFILTLHQKTRDGSTKEGRLNLADLAGSEKVGKTGATGETLEEAKKINQSLSALGNCINALTKSKAKHVPYRDSKLTHILRESLGGNCKSTLLVAASPHIFNLEETISTLMFAKRAKTIKNSVKVNKQRSVEELMAIIEKLKKELGFLKKYVVILEQELEKVKGPNWKDDLPKMAQPKKKAAPTEDKAPSTKDSSATDDADDDEDAQDESQAEEETPSGTPSAAATPTRAQRPAPATNGAASAPRKAKAAAAADTSEEEEEKMYSSSADMSLKMAELQVELKKIKEQAEVDLTDLREEVKSLTQDNEEAEKILAQKNELIKDRDTEIKNLRDELESQQQAKTMAEEKLRYKITQLTLSSEQQEESLETLNSVNADLKKKLEGITQQLDDLEADKERLQREHDRLTREREESTAALSKKAERIETLERSVTEYERTYNVLREQNAHWESQNKALQEKLESTEAKYSTVSANFRETESKLRVMSNTKDFLENRVKDLMSDIETIENDLTEARSMLEKTQQTKEALKEAGQERIEELLHQTVPLEDYERIAKEKEKFRSMVSDVKSALNLEREANSNLRGELEETLSKQKAEHEELSQAWETEKAKRDEQITSLESKLTQLTETTDTQVKQLQTDLASANEQYETERSSRQRLETELEDLQQKYTTAEKKLRRADAAAEDSQQELRQLNTTVKNQSRSLAAQAERIQQLESELEENTKDREILQQEVKTALEINIENAKQFEKQLESVREDAPRRAAQNIRRPVNQPAENRGIIASFFGIKQYPALGEIENPVKYGYLLKRSNWLKKWEKRWFVLVKDRILYFDTNNQALRATGEIELEGTRIVPAGEFTGRPNTLGILHAQRKEYYLQAPNKEEQVDWMTKLSSVSRANTKRPVVPRATQSEANLARP